MYGFYDECKRRCNIKIWKTFVDVFNCLPIAAVVASKIFCVHGGLSPSLSSMDDIRRISRPTDVPDYGLLNDLLWSDPSDTALDWEDNERGVSYCFGKSVIGAFLARYDFDLICRAHMVVEGELSGSVPSLCWRRESLILANVSARSRWLRVLERTDSGHHLLSTVSVSLCFVAACCVKDSSISDPFTPRRHRSRSNYCGEFDNFGSVMSVSEDLLCAFELLKVSQRCHLYARGAVLLFYFQHLTPVFLLSRSTPPNSSASLRRLDEGSRPARQTRRHRSERPCRQRRLPLASPAGRPPT